MSKTINISPLNRVEGDLKIRVEVKDGTLVDAKASGIMFRGFEEILLGRNPDDALLYTPRICGICSISHSVASSEALKSISEQFIPSRSGQYAKNICHATENTMSHITQFYVYFAPDLLNGKYQKNGLYQVLSERFHPGSGKSLKTILAERKRFLEILGLIVGKWPHTLAVHPGGITHSLSASDIVRIKGVLEQFSSVVGSVLFGMPLSDYLAINSLSGFDNAYESSSSDLGLFYRMSKETGLTELGRGTGTFISGGCYPDHEGTRALASGFWDNGIFPLDPGEITESIRYSFFDAPESRSHPLLEMSKPNQDKQGAYSWCKAPRYKGKVVEVGALGRQLINNDPIVTGLFSRHGSTVFTRVFARLHEAAKLLGFMQTWVGLLNPNENYYSKNKIKSDASGAGITEAARGFLGHWISVADGRIKKYQVITPTAWNASPRDENDNPGAIEQALIGTVVEDEDNHVEIDHIVRSFDPCLVCTVH